MQGVFDYASLVHVNIRATGYAFPHANLPRFSSPRSRLLMLQSNMTASDADCEPTIMGRSLMTITKHLYFMFIHNDCDRVMYRLLGQNLNPVPIIAASGAVYIM